MIPTHSTIFALAALRWSWTCSTRFYNHWRVWPGVVALAHHWRWEPDHQVSRCPVQLVLDPCFTRWQPVLRVRCCFANFKYIVQVLQVLNVSCIMPAEPLLPFDYSYHCIHPQRWLHCFQSSILCSFDCWVSCIVTLQSVTHWTDAAFYFSKLRPGLALPGWQAVT